MPTLTRNGTAPSGWGKGASDEEVAERVTCELAQSLQQDFKSRDDLYKDIDSTIFSEFQVEIPEAYKKTAIEVRTPLALHIAQTITSALSVNPQSITFKPVGFGDVYQQNSTLREHFFEAAWIRQEAEAQRQLLRLFMWSLATKGEAIIKTLERTSAVWSSYADSAEKYLKELEADGEYDQHAMDSAYDGKTEHLKLALPYPISSTDVPPETFYYTKNENGKTSVVEIKELPYEEALDRFHAGLDSSGKVIHPQDWQQFDPRSAGLARAEWQRMMRINSVRTIRCIEAWDCQVQTIVLQGPGQRDRSLGSNGSGTLARVKRHSYGDPVLKTLKGPYFHALGITTASRLPEHAGLSVLFGYLPLFQLLNSLLTMQGNAAFMTGFPAFKETQPPGAVPGLPSSALPYGSDGREQQAQRKIEPGKLYPFDIAPVDQPKSGAETEKLIGNVQQMIELALPSVVQGVVAGDQSGYALNQAAYLARLSWDPIIDNAEIALGQRVGFESWLIENRIGENVYAWGEQQGKPGSKRGGGGKTKGSWLRIGPDDLDGVHRYEVHLTPQTPSNEIIEIRALGEKMQLKLISYEDAVTKAGANPDEVEKSWLLHDLKESPEIQQEVKNAVFQKVATIRAARMQKSGITPEELAGQPPTGAAMGPPTGVPGTAGTPPSGPIGGMPGNPVPSPGQGLPIAPPPPGPGMMPPGGIPGMPATPGPPQNALRLPGAPT